jgi:hypothetical protein
VHAAEKLTNKNCNGMRQYAQEPLMVVFVEYLSDGGGEEFPWLR